MKTSSTESDLNEFLTRAKRAPQYTADEERALSVRFCEHGDRAAGEKLAHAQLRHVVSIALSYRRYGIAFGEMVAEGNFGVVRALAKYDPSRGVRFTTYANYWVRSAILEHVVKFWSLVGGGSGALQTRVFFKLRRERARARAIHGDGPEADRALAEAMGVTPEVLVSMLAQVDARDVSFDPLPNAASGPTLESIEGEDDQERAVFLAQVSDDLKRTVNAALGKLDQRERYIARHCLLADREQELTLAQVGRDMGVSRERARQLCLRTMRKLRAHVEAVGPATVRDFIRFEFAGAAPLAAAG